MGLYSYRCTCGHIFDAVNPMNTYHEAVCPKCGAMAAYNAEQTFKGGSPLLKFKSDKEPGRTGWDRIDNGAYDDKSKRKNRRDYEGG